ncbi:hypothetical protein Moror_13066 [Moniliophthora roreri MCA 2997]|uniref:Integral membrane protein n=2 Tax=Moniliophthora roreri TaxID=221103 RepID=V2XLT3_MONRO|nr:hypothetical protein Moror_13066 [Moniliophthora roreri MCA 2997]
MSLENPLANASRAWDTTSEIIFPLTTLSTMYLVYGVYASLFGACVCLLRRRDERQSRQLYFFWIVLLFLLSTIFVVTQTVVSVLDTVVYFTAIKTRDYSPARKHFSNTGIAAVRSITYLTPILLNLVAETMLIHRCYLIWGSRKWVACPLIMASAITNVIGIIGTVFFTIGVDSLLTQRNQDFFIVGARLQFPQWVMSAALNLLITLLTAGRIWWIHCKVRSLGTASSDGNVIQSIPRIILESGLLYPTTTIIGLIIFNTVPPVELSINPSPIVALSAGIAPTLIIVRARLGMTVESLQDRVSEIHFASRPVQRGTVTDAAPHPLNIHFEEDQAGNTKEGSMV